MESTTVPSPNSPRQSLGSNADMPAFSLRSARFAEMHEKFARQPSVCSLIKYEVEGLPESEKITKPQRSKDIAYKIADSERKYDCSKNIEAIFSKGKDINPKYKSDDFSFYEGMRKNKEDNQVGWNKKSRLHLECETAETFLKEPDKMRCSSAGAKRSLYSPPPKKTSDSTAFVSRSRFHGPQSTNEVGDVALELQVLGEWLEDQRREEEAKAFLNTPSMGGFSPMEYLRFGIPEKSEFSYVTAKK